MLRHYKRVWLYETPVSKSNAGTITSKVATHYEQTPEVLIYTFQNTCLHEIIFFQKKILLIYEPGLMKPQISKEQLKEKWDVRKL